MATRTDHTIFSCRKHGKVRFWFESNGSYITDTVVHLKNYKKNNSGRQCKRTIETTFTGTSVLTLRKPRPLSVEDRVYHPKKMLRAESRQVVSFLIFSCDIQHGSNSVCPLVFLVSYLFQVLYHTSTSTRNFNSFLAMFAAIRPRDHIGMASPCVRRPGQFQKLISTSIERVARLSTITLQRTTQDIIALEGEKHILIKMRTYFYTAAVLDRTVLTKHSCFVILLRTLSQRKKIEH